MIHTNLKVIVVKFPIFLILWSFSSPRKSRWWLEITYRHRKHLKSWLKSWVRCHLTLLCLMHRLVTNHLLLEHRHSARVNCLSCYWEKISFCMIKWKLWHLLLSPQSSNFEIVQSFKDISSWFKCFEFERLIIDKKLNLIKIY